MKKNTQSVLAAVLLAGAAFSANAADASHTTKAVVLNAGASAFSGSFSAGLAQNTFADKFSFSVSGASKLVADLTSTAPAAAGLDITGFNLYATGGTLVYSGKKISTGYLDNWKLNGPVLAAGSYYLEVDGKVNSAAAGSFSGNIRVAAVPEPETYAMLLAGLGLIGFTAARRRKNA
jgi:hypothetical protein